MTRPDYPIDPTPDEDDPTPKSIRESLLGQQDRRGPAIRSAFLQQHGGARAPGPISWFAKERRLFALQLYLFLCCVARKAPWDATYSASAWAIALNHTKTNADGTVSRNWNWLADKDLITTTRKFRRVEVTRLLEDGSAEAYTRPKGNYFIFPLDFFREEWHTRLRLPGTVVLLIALYRSRLEPWFELRTERDSGWYGVSPDLLVDGLDELLKAELLFVHQRKVRDPKARYGVTRVNEYLLRGAFAHPDAREADT